MKTITLTIPDDATITVDGVEYPTSTEVKLWTPDYGDSYVCMDADGDITDEKWHVSTSEREWLEAGNILPTLEHAEALDRKRRAESIIFRYFYERGIDTRRKEETEQYCVILKSGKLVTDFYSYTCHGSPFYVESKAIAEQAINDIPDAIRTALMGGWV